MILTELTFRYHKDESIFIAKTSFGACLIKRDGAVINREGCAHYLAYDNKVFPEIADWNIYYNEHRLK